MDKHTQEQQHKEDSGFTAVFLDESFFFYDSLVRRVWIEQDKRPVVRITTGSHQRSCVFGAISIEGKRSRSRSSSYLDSAMYSMEIHFLII